MALAKLNRKPDGAWSSGAESIGVANGTQKIVGHGSFSLISANLGNVSTEYRRLVSILFGSEIA